MLILKNVTKSFPRDGGPPVLALDDLSLEVRSGELLVLMGPNGSGKSTLLRIVAGQLAFESGSCSVGSILVVPANGQESPRTVAYVPQDPLSLAFKEMPLEEHLLLAERTGHPARFWRLGITASRREKYRSFLLHYRVPTLAESLRQPFAALSGGWQQVFSILLAVAKQTLTGHNSGNNNLLLLDEPLANLDITNTEICMTLISHLNHEGHAVILATHDVSLALEASQRVCIMRKGRLVADLTGEDARAAGPEGIGGFLRNSALSPVELKERGEA